MTRSPTLLRVTLVLGTSAGGMEAHVRMLATGLRGQGVAVSLIGPSSAATRFSLRGSLALPFSAVEIGGRPRAGDLVSLLRLRRLFLRPAHGPRGASAGGAEVVHAHGLRAGALSVLALTLARRERPVVVVTVHNAPPAGRGPAAIVYRLLERVVSQRADLVLCVSPDLERRMRAAGARRVERAVIAAADVSADAAASRAVTPPDSTPPGSRPAVLAVGRLTAQKGFDVLLEAAAAWRDLDPMPLVVIAGDGPLAGRLRARAVALGAAAVFLGRVDDIPARLASAAVFVLPSRWEGQPLVLQEALRAGTAIVATRVGGVPGLTGEDAALLVPAGDARALAAAVRAVLTDASVAARLRAAAAARAATLPSEEDAISAALNAYASVTGGTSSAIIGSCP